ncbi:unnamed protein product, partial [Symbiodinium sp. CCMP2456]
EALVHADVNVPTLRASLDDATAPSIPSPVKMQFSPPKQRPPDMQQARAAPPTPGPSSTRAEPSQEKGISGALRRGTPEKRTNNPCPATPVSSTPSPKRAQQTPPTPAKVAQPRPASPCVPVASAPSASAEPPAGLGVGPDPKPKKPTVEARPVKDGRAPPARVPRGPEPASNHSAEQ